MWRAIALALSATLATLTFANPVPSTTNTTSSLVERASGDGGYPWQWPGACNLLGPWTWTERVGPGTGGPWCDFQWNPEGSHQMIWGFDVYWEFDFGIKGINVYYFDDHVGTMHGIKGEMKTVFTIDKGDWITELSTWGNGWGERLGAIKLKTHGGGDFFAGSYPAGGKEHKMELSLQYLIGVVGHSGQAIDNIGFIFLKSGVKSIYEGNVDLKSLPPGADTISTYSSVDVTFGNRGHAPVVIHDGGLSQLQRDHDGNVNDGQCLQLGCVYYLQGDSLQDCRRFGHRDG